MRQTVAAGRRQNAPGVGDAFVRERQVPIYDMKGRRTGLELMSTTS